jgi:hypothetical protein
MSVGKLTPLGDPALNVPLMPLPTPVTDSCQRLTPISFLKEHPWAGVVVKTGTANENYEPAKRNPRRSDPTTPQSFIFPSPLTLFRK